MNNLTHTHKSTLEFSFSLFSWRVWIIATIAAVLLNALLFLLLPALFHPSTQSTELSKRIDNIQVIRIKREKPPAQKKKPKPPEPPKEKPKPQEKISKPNPIATPKLTLPFKLNTRLPQVSADFQLPLADSIVFGSSFEGSIGMAQLDAPLSPISRIPPVYPMRARRNNTEGWVRVSFEVDEQGHVDNLQVLEAKPPGIFEKSVLNCVAKWRYKPGTVEGVPVRAKIETTVRFEMDK